MIVRKAEVKDAKGIVEAHYNSVHNTASQDYSSDVLVAWHGGVTKPRIEKVRKIIQENKEEMFVCEADGNIVGFSSFISEYFVVQAVYVDSSYGGKGVGTSLFSALEARAKELGLKRLQLHSSLTAKNFYLKNGFQIISDGTHTLNNGTKMSCVIMSKHYDDVPIAELVTEDNKAECIEFLEARKETCLFLLGNMESYGVRLNEQLNSGNYRILRRSGSIVGVFSMTKRGNLLIQTDGLDDYSSVILNSVKEDGIEINGIIGPWKDCYLFKGFYSTINNNFKVNFESKEKLYTLPLEAIEDKKSSLQNIEVRLLKDKDFKEWDLLNKAYLKEEGLSVQGTDEQRQENFSEKANSKYWWGLFRDKKLISIGAHNTRYKSLGQIGGVYTVPEERRQGYSKLCMKKLIEDSKSILNLETLILFTGEQNIAAQKLYESLGFKEIGHFGLMFGKVQK